jgi:hypothetical protein
VQELDVRTPSRWKVAPSVQPESDPTAHEGKVVLRASKALYHLHVEQQLLSANGRDMFTPAATSHVSHRQFFPVSCLVSCLLLQTSNHSRPKAVDKLETKVGKVLAVARSLSNGGEAVIQHDKV